MKSKKSNFLLGKYAVDRATNPFDEFSITTLATAFDFHAFCKDTRFKVHCFFGGFEAAVSKTAFKPRQDFLLEKSICFGKFECLFGANARDVLRKLSLVYEWINCTL